MYSSGSLSFTVIYPSRVWGASLYASGLSSSLNKVESCSRCFSARTRMEASSGVQLMRGQHGGCGQFWFSCFHAQGYLDFLRIGLFLVKLLYRFARVLGTPRSDSIFSFGTTECPLLGFAL